jgi:hypothetical protein
MTRPDRRRPAPAPIGDVVSGDPPVPITVWHVPAPPPGATVSRSLAVRLVHNFTHPAELIVDLTVGPSLASAIIAGKRRGAYARGGSEPAALLVTGWPSDEAPAEQFLTDCRRRLRAGGCLAVALPHAHPPVHADLITAAKSAGLAYLQHIVAVTGSTGHGGRAWLRVHTDVLILTRSPSQEAST